MAWPPKDEAKVFLGLSLGALALGVGVLAYHGFDLAILKSVGLYMVFLVALAIHCFRRMRAPD